MPSEHLIGPYVQRFLLEHVTVDRNLSPNTQKSYRDCLLLLFEFVAEHHSTDPTRVTVQQVDASLVREYLGHLEDRRRNCVATRNRRLAAIRSLFRFIARLEPELVGHAARVCAIPDRKAPIPVIAYLSKPEVEALLSTPDRSTAQGRRDYSVLLLLYNTGARASEAARLTIADLTLAGSPCARFLGKGRKHRICPLWPSTVEVLRQVIGARLDGPPETPVFLSQRRSRLTRFGVYELVTRIAREAARSRLSLAKKRVSPHTLRHTTAVHLLQAGVDINTIRAWLGHVSLETTSRYAEVDLETKAHALQTCYESLAQPLPASRLSWHKDSDLMAFLASL